jgi:exopolysaccharide production protein ExoQ
MRLDPYYWLSGYFLLGGMEAFGFIDRIVYGSWSGKQGDKLTQTLNLSFLLAGLVLFAYGYHKTRRIGVGGGLALGTIAFLFLSALWSIDPATSAREAFIYLFIVLGCIGVANIWKPDDYIELFNVCCFSSAVASILLFLLLPSSAFGAYSSDFQGIFPHKNFLGQVMASGALASLHGLRNGVRRQRNIVFLLVFIFMAVAAKSATSWLTILVCCGVDAVVVLIRKGGAARALAIGASVVLVPLLIGIAANPDPILEMIGKDPSLTGRTDLWAFVIGEISEKPLLGWGYFAFWSAANPAAEEISETLGWVVPQAHNGLLEFLLNVGVVGTALFVFILIRNMTLAVRCLSTPAQSLGISTLLTCIGIILVGITEEVLKVPTQPSTSLFFITGLLCEQACRGASLQRYRMTYSSNRRSAPEGRASECRRDSDK